MKGKIAFVTGASRGIGKAIAIELAAAGYDVAILARTVNEGEAEGGAALPGSLATTLSAIEGHGVRGMALPADLLQAETLGAAVTVVLERWGRIDVLVHNAVYQPLHPPTTFLETPIAEIRKQIEGNAVAPLLINRMVLPGMIARGGGTVINITAAAGYGTPLKPAGQGGWELGYGMSKAAMHRIPGILRTELGNQGIRAYNVQPGFIATERLAIAMKAHGFDATYGAPPQAPAKVVRWLCEHPEAAMPYDGRNIEALDLCHRLGLLPGWDGAVLDPEGVMEPDLSGYEYRKHMEFAPKVGGPGK